MYSLETLKSEHPQYQEIFLYFRTNACSIMFQDAEALFKHLNQNSCYNSHNPSETRRHLIDEQNNCLMYEQFPCPSLQEGYPCAEGIRCRFCHNQNEIDYHPFNYKTEPCTDCMFPNNPRFCPRYHPEEINRKAFVESFTIFGNEGLAQFNLDSFKVKPCNKKGNHNLKICNFYHHDKDRRRPSSIHSYAPPMCQYVTRNAVCPNGDSCKLSHNKLEQLYHPERHKRKFCLYYPHNIHKCEYGSYCSFAHSESEIVVEMIHNMKQDEYFYLYKYKTVFCPYISEHDRNQCVYAHNPQDLRRDPNQHKYNAIQCPFWSQGQIFCYDEGGCPKQMECENCHGWKELEYHPYYYKTKPCNNGKKCNKKDCPFYHSTSERRQLKVTSQLTRSLLLQNNNSNAGSPLQQTNMMVAGSPQPFDQDAMMVPMDRQIESNFIRPAPLMFMPFKPNEHEAKMMRFGGSSPGMESFTPSTHLTDDELPNSLSYKQKHHTMESPVRRFGSMNGGSGSLDKNKSAQARSIYSQPIDLWGSFQPESQDKFEDFFASIKNIKIENEIVKGNDSFDRNEDGAQYKTELESEKSFGLTNEQFKKALVQNLEKKGLSNTIQYLVNPLIDLKALKAFSSKDFHLFPHISNEDKVKIVKIIQDVLEEEALLTEVNNAVNDYESHLDFLPKAGRLQRYGLI